MKRRVWLPMSYLPTVNWHGSKEFVLECRRDTEWIPVAEGTTVGYKRILRFDPLRCSEARIVIKESRDIPQISEIGFYKASEEETAKE